MLLVGYETGRWRFHNSWGKRPNEPHSQESIVGDDREECHDVVATDEWFETHVFHAVVHSDVVPMPDGQETRDASASVGHPVDGGSVTGGGGKWTRVSRRCRHIFLHHGPSVMEQPPN